MVTDPATALVTRPVVRATALASGFGPGPQMTKEDFAKFQAKRAEFQAKRAAFLKDTIQLQPDQGHQAH